jgi:WD40 repeat protein
MRKFVESMLISVLFEHYVILMMANVCSQSMVFICCRDSHFILTVLFTASSDKSIGMIDSLTYLVVRKQSGAHDSAVYSLAARENLLASGDDEGTVKLWDLRQRSLAHKFEEQEGFVAQLLFVPSAPHELIAIGSCGYVASLDIRTGSSLRALIRCRTSPRVVHADQGRRPLRCRHRGRHARALPRRRLGRAAVECQSE